MRILVIQIIYKIVEKGNKLGEICMARKTEYGTIRKGMLLFTMIMVALISLTGCSEGGKKTEEITQKIAEEIKYLDNRFIYILNSLNHISYDNYTVLPIEIEEGKIPDAEESNTTGGSQNQENGESEEGKSKENTEGEEEKGEKKEQTSLSPDTILNNRNTQIDWETLKKDVENLHDIWATILLDLYKVDLDSNSILNFGKQLDIVTSNIAKEDKSNTIVALADLYGFLPQYSASCLNEFSTNLYQTKANIVLSYSAVETDNWEEVTARLQQAEEYFNKVMNDMSFQEKKQYTVNKSYILLKELQSSVELQEKEIYYIKYKNLISEINLLTA